MPMHSFHNVLEGYDERQIFHDGCIECVRRGKDFSLALNHMDESTLERAWKRAYNLESINGNREAVGPVSISEKPFLEALWAIQVMLKRRGFPMNGEIPRVEPFTLYGMMLSSAIPPYDMIEKQAREQQQERK